MVDCERYLLDAGKAEKIDKPFKDAKAKLIEDVFIYPSSNDLVQSSLANVTNDLRNLHTDTISLIWKIKKRTNPPTGAVEILERERDKIRALWDSSSRSRPPAR